MLVLQILWAREFVDQRLEVVHVPGRDLLYGFANRVAAEPDEGIRRRACLGVRRPVTDHDEILVLHSK